MKRRGFLKLLLMAPIAPAVAKALPAPAEVPLAPTARGLGPRDPPPVDPEFYVSEPHPYLTQRGFDISDELQDDSLFHVHARLMGLGVRDKMEREARYALKRRWS